MQKSIQSSQPGLLLGWDPRHPGAPDWSPFHWIVLSLNMNHCSSLSLSDKQPCLLHIYLSVIHKRPGSIAPQTCVCFCAFCLVHIRIRLCDSLDRNCALAGVGEFQKDLLQQETKATQPQQPSEDFWNMSVYSLITWHKCWFYILSERSVSLEAENPRLDWPNPQWLGGGE